MLQGNRSFSERFEMKSHFLIKLIPPRTSFALDMTNEERRLMHEHVVYWTGLAERGIALLFGPVLDPAGSYGIGVVELEQEEDLRVLIANDPVTSTDSLFRHESYVMPQLIVGRTKSIPPPSAID
jgi:hypothetical protein